MIGKALALRTPSHVPLETNMNILLTNDDGWDAPGLEKLQQIASQFGDVWTVAPLKPMSGISHQVTFEVPMTFEEKSARSFSLDGTPADCVRVGLTQLQTKFDWVFSGINRGANLGTDTNFSGTVAAVREASLFNVPGIAFSQHLRHFKAPFDWTPAGQLAERVIPELLERKTATSNWFNVNLPDIGDGDAAQVDIVEAELDQNPLPATYDSSRAGKLLYCGTYNDRPRTPGCDADVCFSGKVSISLH